MPDVAQISGDTSAALPADNPATGHAEGTAGTPQTNGQPDGQTGHVDDLFKGIDPQKLPPELRPHLDNMVRTYREKTEKLSETLKSEVAKATEAYRQKAEFYDQVSQQEEFVKQWNEFVQKSSQPQNGAEQDQPLQRFEQQLQEVKMELQKSKALEVVNAFADAVNEKGEKLHPDFEKMSGIKLGTHTQAGDYDLLRTAIELAPGATPAEKMENGYKAAKAVYDSIFEEGKKAGMGRVQNKARNGTFAPSGASGVAGMAPHRAKNALEALQFARQGLAPSQE